MLIKFIHVPQKVHRRTLTKQDSSKAHNNIYHLLKTSWKCKRYSSVLVAKDCHILLTLKMHKRNPMLMKESTQINSWTLFIA